MGSNIMWNFKEIHCGDVDCAYQAEDRAQWKSVVNTVMHI